MFNLLKAVNLIKLINLMNDTDNLVYSVARSGTPVNPGLPASLAYLLVSQARHETGDYTSNFFRNNNNLFGYSYVPGARYQSGGGGIADNGQQIANYSSLKDSVYEIVDWIYRRRSEGKFPALETIQAPEQYAALLKGAGYYGDKVENYTAGLKRFFLLNPALVTGGGLGIAIALAVVIYLMFRKK